MLAWLRTAAWLSALAAHAPLRRAPVAQHSAAAARDGLPGAVRVGDGLYYNERLRAHNVWEINVDMDLIDEAAAIFERARPLACAHPEPYDAFSTPSGRFFAHRVSWQSDIAWISADDRKSLGALRSIFDRMSMAERFASVVPHERSLRLYSAFFVSRSKCAAPTHRRTMHIE